MGRNHQKLLNNLEELRKGAGLTQEELSTKAEVSRKSMKKLIDWKENNPDYKDMNSDFSNKCIMIHQESNAGDNREIYYPKVIKTLAKETSIKQKL